MHIRRWIALIVVLSAMTIGLPSAYSYAGGASQDLTPVISVAANYYLPQGSGWVDSSQSDAIHLPWGQGVAVQRVAVRWSLKAPASTAPIATGDYFTLQVPLTFSTEATASVLSPRGTAIGTATFATSGAIRVVFDVSALSSAELPLTTGYIPFLVSRPSTTGNTGSGGSGSASHSSGSSSTGGSGSSWYSSGLTSSNNEANSPTEEESSPATETTTPSKEPTSTEETAPPVTSTTTNTPSDSGGYKSTDDVLGIVGQVGTIILGIFALAVFYLAFLISRKRKSLAVS